MFVADLFLTEAPIEDLSLVGDWSKNSSFRNPTDRALLTNPKGQAKIIHKWEKTVVPFNIYFVNSPEAGRHKEVGKVDADWMATNMPKTLPQLRLRDDAVNIIYTNNSAAEWAPMTAWVTAHRFAHVVKALPEFGYFSREVFTAIKRILSDAYRQQAPHKYDFFEKRDTFDKMMTKFMEAIGTFRSAREGNIRSPYEFLYELVAQYMITGKVKFNPIPRSFGHGRMAWGRATNSAYAHPDYHESSNEELEELAAQVNNDCERLLHACVGHIFVM